MESVSSLWSCWDSSWCHSKLSAWLETQRLEFWWNYKCLWDSWLDGFTRILILTHSGEAFNTTLLEYVPLVDFVRLKSSENINHMIDCIFCASNTSIERLNEWARNAHTIYPTHVPLQPLVIETITVQPAIVGVNLDKCVVLVKSRHNAHDITWIVVSLSGCH